MIPRLLPALVGMLAAATPARGQDLIRQIQTINGQPVIRDIPLNTTRGTILSSPVSDNTVFQLYSQVDIPPSGGYGLFLGTTVLDLGLELSLSLFGRGAAMKFVKVDETTVGTYMPVVEIEALSEDPHVPARTRVDRPYGIRMKISGLRADAAAPEYARKVQVRRAFRTYDPLIYAPTAATLSGDYVDATTLSQNGTFVDNAILPRLPAERPTRISGEETFAILTHPDAGQIQTRFAAATVQVWPVATSEIEGIESGRTYQAPPTTGSVRLTDLYPKSVTYVQVYRGVPAIGTSGTPLGSTVVAYDSSVPQNAMVSISGLDQVVKEDGTYTLEVLTITPFNGGAPERLAHTTFKLDRTIKVVGNVATLEN